jgi:hypothetical protein
VSNEALPAECTTVTVMTALSYDRYRAEITAQTHLPASAKLLGFWLERVGFA